MEPWESVDIEVPQDLSASIIDKMSQRFAELKDVVNEANGNTRMTFECISTASGTRVLFRRLRAGENGPRFQSSPLIWCWQCPFLEFGRRLRWVTL